MEISEYAIKYILKAWVEIRFFLLVLSCLDKLIISIFFRRSEVQQIILQTINRQLQRGNKIAKCYTQFQRDSPLCPLSTGWWLQLQSTSASDAWYLKTSHRRNSQVFNGWAHCPAGMRTSAIRPQPLHHPEPRSTYGLGSRAAPVLQKRCRGSRNLLASAQLQRTRRSLKRTQTNM